MKPYWSACILLLHVLIMSCTKTDNGEISEAKLILRYKFDSTQQRLNSKGEPSSLAAENAAQSPVINSMAVHYIELCPDASTPLGKGSVIYRGAETDIGGARAIDYAQAAFFGNYEVFFAIPLKDIPAGEYEWLRLEPVGMNCSVLCHVDTTVTITTDTSSNTIEIDQYLPGRIMGFTGYNTYIRDLQFQTGLLTIEGNRRQGFWGFETTISGEGFSEVHTDSARSPDGRTTVVNPLYATSPVPVGSGVITAAFVPGKLVITGKETENIIVEVSLSTNRSFEWTEIVGNGKWDPLKGEPVADMGIRGMIPVIK